jgi:Mg2+ and Co2+ transporter CorA
MLESLSREERGSQLAGRNNNSVNFGTDRQAGWVLETLAVYINVAGSMVATTTSRSSHGKGRRTQKREYNTPEKRNKNESYILYA